MSYSLRSRIKLALTSSRRRSVLLIIILSILLPLIPASSYIKHILVMALVYIILTLSLNLIAGDTGYISFAHPAFFAIGAYTSALLLKYQGLPFAWAFLLSGLIPAVISIAVGYIFLSKVSGFAFAMVTLAFNAIVGVIIRSGLPSFGIEEVSAIGIYNIPRAAISIPFFFTFRLTTAIHYYYLILSITLIFIYFTFRLKNSKLGRAMIAIREDEMLAESLGINTLKYKMIAFTVGAFFAGVAGGFLAPYITYVGPDFAQEYYWILFFTMLFAGGAGTIAGSITGAIIFSVAPELLRFAPGVSITPEFRQMLFGLFLLIVIIRFPKGIYGEIKDLMYKRKVVAQRS